MVHDRRPGTRQPGDRLGHVQDAPAADAHDDVRIDPPGRRRVPVDGVRSRFSPDPNMTDDAHAMGRELGGQVRQPLFGE